MLDHPRYGVWRTKSSEELFQIYVIEVSISMLVSCMQMASKAGKSLLPRSASKPQEEMFSFSPPSRHTDKLPHSSSAAGNVQRERDATAAAQLSQLHFAERMPGASLLHALTECMAGPDGGACEHDSSNSPGDDSTQHTAATRQAATLAASRPSASLPQSANLHQENGHSAATPARGGSVKGSVSEARDRPSARDAVGQQPDLPMSSGSSNTEGGAPASGQRRASMDSGLQPGPVFVPIVLTMDDADHEHLVEEWVLRQMVSAPVQPSLWQGKHSVREHHRTNKATFWYTAMGAEEKQQGPWNDILLQDYRINSLISARAIPR